MSYLSFLDTIFPLDVLLDEEYWRYHKFQLKHLADETIPKADQAKAFVSLTTGEPIEGLTWVNTVDSASPYNSGYQDKSWVVSLNPTS